MRNLTFTIFFLLISIVAFSQTTIIENNFDAYANGEKIAQVAGSPWTTWSNAPGGSEDGTISNAQSVSPTNSLHIVTNNDQIVDYGDLTTGRYRIDFDIMVEAGKFGYFNALLDFAAGGSKWAMQVYFKDDLSGSVDAGAGDVATFTYTADTWMHIRMFVDLDNDLGTLILDGTELVSWKWSTGSFGSENLLKLDATNFFGWNGSKGSAGYFIDNFVFASLPTLDAVTNVTAVLNAESTGVDVSWDAPTNAPDSYSLVRNSKSYVSGITALTYSDANLYPGGYTYNVNAFYSELGYAPSSAPTNEVTIAGGVARNLVLFEIGTGTNCGYCPGAAMGAHDLLEGGQNVAIIKYQTYSTNDPYYNGVGLDRVGDSFYGIHAYPTTIVGGVLRREGGSATQTLYPLYRQLYNERISRPSLYTINMTVANNGNHNYTATIDVEQISDYLSNPVKLYTAVTESHSQYNWGNQTEVNERCMGMYPTEAGTALDFTSGTTLQKTIDFSFTYDDDLTDSDYELIVFVQEDNTKEVIQAIKFNLADAVTGIKNMKSKEISIYPNPAQDYITVSAPKDSKVEIFNVSGKLLVSKTLNTDNETISVKTLNSGIYFMNVKSDTHVFNTKFIVN